MERQLSNGYGTTWTTGHKQRTTDYFFASFPSSFLRNDTTAPMSGLR
jgi:hypothetical protein